MIRFDIFNMNYNMVLLLSNCLEYAINLAEQFTVKAHPALFEGEGRGKKNIEEHFPEASA